MSRESLVFVFGCIVFFTTFLGVPQHWKELIFISAGVVLMVLGYSLRRTAFFRSIETAQGERRGDSFVESVHREEGEEDVIQKI